MMAGYFRESIERMVGYVPGEQPRGGPVLKLNTNENPYPPSPKVLQAIARMATARLRLYPDPLATSFREAAGTVLGVSPDWIIACNGSDDALTILTRACLDQGDLMKAPLPTYGLYEVLAGIQGCRFEACPLALEGHLPADLTQGAKLVFIANPNAPTGVFLPPADIAAVAQRAACLVVADEAYADFAPANCISHIAQCERLVVTRTLSKSYSLAGIRFGYIVAQPEVVARLRKVKDSYNCDAVSIAAATAALQDQEYFRENVRKICATRRRLELSLAELGFGVTPSHGNFVWARRSEPVGPLYEALKQRGILVRWLRFPGYGDGLRVSVGTDDEINQLLDQLRGLL